MRVLSQEETGRKMGTSFHDTVIYATPQQLIDAIGSPSYANNEGEDKVNMEWVCETGDGEVFTIYDWKYYRPLEMDEEVGWHIGGKNGIHTYKGKVELEEALGY